MKVLQRICPYCGLMLLFSVEVLSRKNTDPSPGSRCPSCYTALSQGGALTEIGIEEPAPTRRETREALFRLGTDKT